MQDWPLYSDFMVTFRTLRNALCPIILCNFVMSFQDDLVWGDNHHRPDFRDGRRRGGQWHRGPRDDDARLGRSKSKRQEKRDR